MNPATAREPQSITIKGGAPLFGKISVAGAKNALSKQLVASLLTTEPCHFTNVPNITEIHATLAMLESIGTLVEWTGPDALTVHTPKLKSSKVSER